MLIPDKVLHNETQRHIARLAVRTNARIQALDTLVRSLHAEGVWDKLHTLNIAVGSSADTLLDLKGNQDSVLVGSPAFLPDRGFTTVSTTDYIDTVISPPDADQDQGLSCYIRQAMSPTGGVYLMGKVHLNNVSLAVQVDLMAATSSLFNPHIQFPTTINIPISGGGFMGASIGAGGVFNAVADEMAYTTPLTPIAGDGTVRSAFVGCRNSLSGPANPSDNQFAHWSITKSMTTVQWLAYDNLIKDYFTTAGTAV